MPSRRPPHSPASTEPPPRDVRLAAALRANLARRKAQAVARRGGGGAAAVAAAPEGGAPSSDDKD